MIWLENEVNHYIYVCMYVRTKGKNNQFQFRNFKTHTAKSQQVTTPKKKIQHMKFNRRMIHLDLINNSDP